MKPLYKYETLLVGLLTISVFMVSINEGAKYGEKCNSTEVDPCDSGDITNPLQCSSANDTGVCQCLEGMFILPTTNRCVAPQNGTCTIVAGDGLPHRECTSYAQCYPQAPSKLNNERTSGICHCDPDTVYDPQTKQCKFTFGATRCSSETDCNVNTLLICENKTCVCQEKSHVWDTTLGKCIAPFGGKCTPNYPYPKPDCGTNMKCNASTANCECNEGFIPTPEKTCGKPFNDSCNQKPDCHSQFECEGNENNKKCVCKAGQLYDEKTTTCRIKVGDDCEPENTSKFDCIVHSVCSDKKCKCEPGFISAGDGTCIALLGSSCENVGCNIHDFLQCDNKQCACMIDYILESTKCNGLIGKSCNTTQKNCVANSECINEVCSCEKDKQEAQEDNKICLALYGNGCSQFTPCSSKYNLGCQNSVCGCSKPDEQLYDGTKSCVGKAGGACYAGLGCVQDAHCGSDSICQCKTNFERNEEGRCVQIQTTDGSGIPIVASSALLLSLTFIAIK